MIDRTGRVVINPSAPLDITDFQRLYLGEGPDPLTAAGNIHMRYPVEARTHLNDTWRSLGIRESPEQYFSNPQNIVDLPDATPSVAMGINRARQSLASRAVQPSGWPTFNSDADRIAAIATGEYDPNYSSPLQKKKALALQALAQRDQAEIDFNTQRNFPINPKLVYDQSGNVIVQNPKDVLSAQLAGTVGGDIAQVLRSMQKIPRTAEDFTSESAGPELKPYVPGVAGYGKVAQPGTTQMDRLDRDLYFDDQFQKILQRDPKQANFVYQRLTGRTLDSDIKSHTDLRADQVKSGFDFTKRAIEQGAKFDPQTNTWQIWNTAEAPVSEGGISLGTATPRPYRQFVPATEQQNAWLNQHYQNVTGGTLPKSTAPSVVNDQRLNSFISRQTPEVQAAVAAVANEAEAMGSRLTPIQMIEVAKKVITESSPANTTWNRTLQGLQDFSDWMVPELKPTQPIRLTAKQQTMERIEPGSTRRGTLGVGRDWSP